MSGKLKYGALLEPPNNDWNPAVLLVLFSASKANRSVHSNHPIGCQLIWVAITSINTTHHCTPDAIPEASLPIYPGLGQALSYISLHTSQQRIIINHFKKKPLPQQNQTFLPWRFSLYQRASSEEACSVLLPVLTTVEIWRAKVKMSGCAEVIVSISSN